MSKEYRLDIAQQVARDLHEIEFYKLKLGSYSDNVKELIASIRSEIRRLGLSPFSDPILNNKTTIETNYRYSVINDYVIIYEVLGVVVKIYRVFSAKQNYLHILGLR